MQHMFHDFALNCSHVKRSIVIFRKLKNKEQNASITNDEKVVSGLTRISSVPVVTHPCHGPVTDSEAQELANC